MKIVYSLEEIKKNTSPTILTIGNFDGLHLGHRALLEHLQLIAKRKNAKKAVLTFSNHPSTVLNPTALTPLLCTVAHKIQLLNEASIDLLILLPFTKELSEESAGTFLSNVKKTLTFDTLILGSDAHIGKNREGNRSVVSDLSKALGFSIEYFLDCTKDGQRISSSLIRNHIQRGHLKEAENFLGRPYSIYSSVLKGNGRGTSLGFSTANLALDNLCLPPFGVYAVNLSFEGKTLPGVANLGIAPTIREGNHPFLEVHLFDTEFDLYGKIVDVRFFDFIRVEQRFNNVEALRKQIACDVISAKKIHEKISCIVN